MVNVYLIGDEGKVAHMPKTAYVIGLVIIFTYRKIQHYAQLLQLKHLLNVRFFFVTLELHKLTCRSHLASEVA